MPKFDYTNALRKEVRNYAGYHELTLKKAYTALHLFSKGYGANPYKGHVHPKKNIEGGWHSLVGLMGGDSSLLPCGGALKCAACSAPMKHDPEKGEPITKAAALKFLDGGVVPDPPKKKVLLKKGAQLVIRASENTSVMVVEKDIGYVIC